MNSGAPLRNNNNISRGAYRFQWRAQARKKKFFEVRAHANPSQITEHAVSYTTILYS